MPLHPDAGRRAPRASLINVPRLITDYYAVRPDPSAAGQRVSFGTSGHRGSARDGAFNEAHILAVTQAICHYRERAGIDGPLFLGFDTHALSEPAFATALEVLAANGVRVRVDGDRSWTPTPALSHAILVHNRGRTAGRADGIVITPSHNPPEDGGFKYNPPHGGPAGGEVTGWIQDEANRLLEDGLSEVRRVPFERALCADTTERFDFVTPYVDDLGSVLELEAAAAAGLKIGADPLGGAGVRYWGRIAERWKLDLEVVNDTVDYTFGFMPLDKDGRIRMDCSSPYAMSGLIGLKDRFDLAFGNDTDHDRHGIVTPSAGLLNPNHYLAAAVWYLFQHRPEWPAAAQIGKTLVSSSILDRVAAELDRGLAEVPVGFKWFVDGLIEGRYGFAGEESAGASFLRKDGTVWTTDKDGLLLNLLAVEMTARLGRDPGEVYAELTARLGDPVYERIDAPATPDQKAKLKAVQAEQVTASTLAGEPILARITRAPANDEPIGGLKVLTENGWFAARPSGTEDVYKIYAESFLGEEHLQRIQAEAKALVDAVIA